MVIQQPYEELTFARVRVLRALAQTRTIREAARLIGLSYNGMRSHVRDLERILDCADLEALRTWWADHEDDWLAYCRACASGRIVIIMP
jgi:hypothetical protein